MLSLGGKGQEGLWGALPPNLRDSDLDYRANMLKWSGIQIFLRDALCWEWGIDTERCGYDSIKSESLSEIKIGACGELLAQDLEAK